MWRLLEGSAYLIRVSMVQCLLETWSLIEEKRYDRLRREFRLVKEEQERTGRI